MKQLLALAILCSFFTACLNDSSDQGKSYKITINNLPEYGYLVYHHSCWDNITYPKETEKNTFSYEHLTGQETCQVLFTVRNDTTPDISSASKPFLIPLGKDTSITFSTEPFIENPYQEEYISFFETDSSHIIYRPKGIGPDFELPQFNTFSIRQHEYIYSKNENNEQLISEVYNHESHKRENEVTQQSHTPSSRLHQINYLETSYSILDYLSIDKELIYIRGFKTFGYSELSLNKPSIVLNDSTIKTLKKNLFPVQFTRVFNGDTTHAINDNLPFFSYQFGYCSPNSMDSISTQLFPTIEGREHYSSLFEPTSEFTLVTLPIESNCEGTFVNDGAEYHFNLPTLRFSYY